MEENNGGTDTIHLYEAETDGMNDGRKEIEGWHVQLSCVNTKVLRATEPCFANDFYPKSENQTKPIAVTASNPPVKILVIGVGSSGSNTVDHMVTEGIGPVSFAALNTDVQALRRSRAPIRRQLGEQLTKVEVPGLTFPWDVQPRGTTVEI